jgi:hypothetical protein
MRRVARITRTALVVVAITLTLDFVLTATVLPPFINKDRDVAEAAKWRVYTGAPYHHDLAPGIETPRVWGRIIYHWKADQYGFRTGTCAPGEAEKSWPAIFVIGDSFVEALASSYEQSFAGPMACDAAKQKKAVWNLGVASYSPIIYWRKVLVAAKKLDVKPSEVYVFLDLSDIDDEANVYHEAEDGTVKYKSMPEPTVPALDFGQWLVEHFMTARLAYDLYISASFNWRLSLRHERARWTIDQGLLNAWGKRGLELAGANLFKDPGETALHTYYIEGDVHFTEAGNRLIYETVKQAVGGDW